MNSDKLRFNAAAQAYESSLFAETQIVETEFAEISAFNSHLSLAHSTCSVGYRIGEKSAFGAQLHQ